MTRTILSFSLAAAACIAGLAAPALAVAPSVAAVYDAGRCMVQRDRRASAALIQSLPLDGAAADLSALRDSDALGCLPAADGVSTMLLRGAIAQALFLRDFPHLGREPLMNVGLVNLSLPVEASPGGPRTVELYRWSDCVVRNDIDTTQRLLRSAIRSSDEAAAFVELQTYMSACMRGDTQLTVRSSEARSLFAQSAYFAMYRYWTGQIGQNRRSRRD